MKIGVSLPVRELRDDLSAIRDFAQLAEELGFTHLRVPDQVARPQSGHLHEPMALLCWVAATTASIELVPSVIVLPARQTLMVAKQAATLDVLSGGRLRLGVGVGGSRDEYTGLGQDFSTRGRRCSEQMQLLRRLWTEPEVHFEGEFDRIDGNGIDPLPIQKPIPLWIGGASAPSAPVLRRIGAFARAVGRDPASIDAESGVGIAGRSEQEWMEIVAARRATGVTHLCMRTLGGDLDASGHLAALRRIRELLDGA
jgi:alkanesulfonate monooxygenase SsuD/methylene tetrahydromethanopterin reductase-like flavin-dependent oxidoreductase (luciferase family)